MDGKEQILKLLKTAKGKNIDVCAMIYSIIKQGNQGAKLLQYFCENAEGVVSSEEVEAPKLFTEGEMVDYEKSYGKIINGILDKILLEKPTKEEFYTVLWEKITLKELFDNEKDQIFALYYVWLDNRIPYFELPETIHIEKEEYKDLTKKLLTKEQKARFILSSDFNQWTEVCYLLLELLNEIPEKKEKAVLFSYIFQMREKMLLSKLISSNIEGEQGEGE